MLFTDFMKLYRNKFFDKIAISVGSGNYEYYLKDDIDDIVIKYGNLIVSKIDYDSNSPRVLYVDLICSYSDIISLKDIRVLIENRTTISVQDRRGGIIDSFTNYEDMYCFYDNAIVLCYYFLNDVFWVRVYV